MVKHETRKCGYHFKQITKPILSGAMGSSLSQVQFFAVPPIFRPSGGNKSAFVRIFVQTGNVRCRWILLEKWGLMAASNHWFPSPVGANPLPSPANPSTTPSSGPRHTQEGGYKHFETAGLQPAARMVAKGLRKSIASILSIWFFSCVVRFLHVPNCVAHLTIRRFYSKTSFISTNQPISESTFSGRVSSDTRSPRNTKVVAAFISQQRQKHGDWNAPHYSLLNVRNTPSKLTLLFQQTQKPHRFFGSPLSF